MRPIQPSPSRISFASGRAVRSAPFSSRLCLPCRQSRYRRFLARIICRRPLHPAANTTKTPAMPNREVVHPPGRIRVDIYQPLRPTGLRSIASEYLLDFATALRVFICRLYWGPTSPQTALAPKLEPQESEESPFSKSTMLLRSLLPRSNRPAVVYHPSRQCRCRRPQELRDLRPRTYSHVYCPSRVRFFEPDSSLRSTSFRYTLLARVPRRAFTPFFPFAFRIFLSNASTTFTLRATFSSNR